MLICATWGNIIIAFAMPNIQLFDNFVNKTDDNDTDFIMDFVGYHNGKTLFSLGTLTNQTPKD